MSLSPILWTRCIFLVLCQHLQCRRWVCKLILLCRRHRHRRQYHEPLNAPSPPPSETCTRTRCIFCFFNWHLRCRFQNLRLIFLFRRLHRGRQFLRIVIAAHQPLLSSPNLQSLGNIVYSLSFVNASVVVVDSVGHLLKYYLPLGCWLHISYGGGLHMWLLVALVYLTLLEMTPLKTVEVRTEYLDYFTSNINPLVWVQSVWLATLMRQGKELWI